MFEVLPWSVCQLFSAKYVIIVVFVVLIYLFLLLCLRRIPRPVIICEFLCQCSFRLAISTIGHQGENKPHSLRWLRLAGNSESSALLLKPFLLYCFFFRVEKSLKRQDDLLKIQQSSCENIHLFFSHFGILHPPPLSLSLSCSLPSPLSKGHFVPYLSPAVFLSVITRLLTSHPVAKTKDQH